MEMQNSGGSSSSRSAPITTLLPHRIKGSVPKKLFTSSIFLLRCLNSPQLPPWMVLAVESSKAGVTQFFNPFTRTLITNLPQNLHVSQFHSTCLTSEYHVVSSYDPFPSDSLYLKALIVDGVSSVSSKCTLLTLFKGGQVFKAYPFDGSDYHAFEKAFHISTIVEDVVVYNSNVYAVSNQEKLYLYSQSQQGGNSRRFFNGDCGYYFDQVVVDTPIDSYSSTNVNMRRALRRRLVVLTSSKDHDSNKLYMIIPVVSFKGFMRADQLQFKVKELKQKGSSKWIWEEVTCFGDGDQVLFVSRDYCFFVDVAEFPECHLRNCIVFSDDAFPEYSESECCWNYGSKGGNEVAVFTLEGHGHFSVPVDSYFPNILWSIPHWLSQNTSLQPQAQSQSRRQSEPGITPSDSNVRHKKPLKSASEEQSIGFSSSNEAQAESAEIFPDMTDVRHSVNHDVGRDDVEDANGQIQSDFSAHLVQSFEKKVVTVKFQGIDVELEHLPILEKVRRKYGDVVDGSAIRGCDAITMVWTSLAKLLLILQSNSGNTLTDDQAHYLSTTLSDLKFMQLKVDWLVPRVKKAVAMQKRKQLQASLAEIEKAKARAEEMERNLLSEMAELRQDGPFHLEDCLDDGVF